MAKWRKGGVAHLSHVYSSCSVTSPTEAVPYCFLFIARCLVCVGYCWWCVSCMLPLGCEMFLSVLSVLLITTCPTGGHTSLPYLQRTLTHPPVAVPPFGPVSLC